MNKRKFKRTNKVDGKFISRELSEYESEYLNQLKEYDKVLQATLLISRNQQGIDTTGRGVRAVRIFTRQTLSGISLRNILPFPTKKKHKEEDIWDVGSISSLSRNILESFLSILYFGTERVTEEEAELRFLLSQYHRNKEWYSIRKQFDPDNPDLKNFEENLPKQREQIKNHNYLLNLNEVQKNKVLRGHEIYKTKTDFEADHPVCKGLRRDHQLLSNFVHPLPLSIERIDNENGRGIGNEADVIYCINALMIARKYLAASTIEISDFFYELLSVRFKDFIDPIRKLAQ